MKGRFGHSGKGLPKMMLLRLISHHTDSGNMSAAMAILVVAAADCPMPCDKRGVRGSYQRIMDRRPNTDQFGWKTLSQH